MKILVTGGKGFIGSKLVERLRQLGNEVEIFDAADGKNICNSWQVDEAIQYKDAVFHLAAVADLNMARVNPLSAMRINIEGTWNVADACRRHGAKLYFASTCCVYGNQEYHPVTEYTLPNPAEIYACSKLADEYVIKGFHHTYGLDYVMMRFATVYGPDTRPALGTHIFMGQALRGELITVHGDGRQTRTLTYIDDLIDAIVAIYQSGKKNDTWNLTTTEEISALQMALDILKLTGSSSKITFVPQRVGQTFRESVSADKIKRDTGWEAKTSWDDGIRLMYQWFIETNQVTNIYKLPSDNHLAVVSQK